MEYIAWPIVVFVLVVIFIFTFKKSITGLLDRTEKIGKEGIQTRPTREQHVEEPISQVDESLKVFDNQLLLDTEKWIKSSLDNLHPRDAEEREKFLLRTLAQALINLSFEKIYYSIYNSQMSALIYLNENRQSSQTVDNIRNLFDDAMNNYPLYYENYSFEDWINYLVTSNLIQRNGNDIGITVRGKEFLKYVLDMGYPSMKAG